MKKALIIFLFTVISTAIGIYFRPSYFLIGQLDWWNVLSKGQFANALTRFFSQSLMDESFYFVMRFTAGGLIGGFLLVKLLGSKKAVSKKKK